MRLHKDFTIQLPPQLNKTFLFIAKYLDTLHGTIFQSIIELKKRTKLFNDTPKKLHIWIWCYKTHVHVQRFLEINSISDIKAFCFSLTFQFSKFKFRNKSLTEVRKSGSLQKSYNLFIRLANIAVGGFWQKRGVQITTCTAKWYSLGPDSYQIRFKH